MNQKSVADVRPAAPSAGGALQKWFRARVMNKLDGLRDTQLIVRERDQVHLLGDGGELQAEVDVRHPGVWRMMATGGSVGVAEAYMLSLWECDDLTTLVRIFVRNRERLDAMERGTARIAAPVLRLLHAWNRNTLGGSRRNIAAHYDLGNEVFELFLDRHMMYSSAIYETGNETLDEASTLKLQRVCDKLALSPEDHLLEIGSGWGGLAIYAARHYGCRVTSVTISEQQKSLAEARVRAAGLSDRIEIRLQDYRAISGRYDKLVSIEMIEAVGHQYLDTYIRKCGELLRDDGLMLLQAITIEDHRYQRAIKDVDFIKRYIFPGSFIPSVAAITGAVQRVSNLRLFHLEDIGPSYARTLAEWHRRFADAKERILQLGYSDTFIRKWRYYLAYCEGGFMERSIGDVQMLLTKPLCRREQLTAPVSTIR